MECICLSSLTSLSPPSLSYSLVLLNSLPWHGFLECEGQLLPSPSMPPSSHFISLPLFPLLLIWPLPSLLLLCSLTHTLSLSLSLSLPLSLFLSPSLSSNSNQPFLSHRFFTDVAKPVHRYLRYMWVIMWKWVGPIVMFIIFVASVLHQIIDPLHYSVFRNVRTVCVCVCVCVWEFCIEVSHGLTSSVMYVLEQALDASILYDLCTAMRLLATFYLIIILSCTIICISYIVY